VSGCRVDRLSQREEVLQTPWRSRRLSPPVGWCSHLVLTQNLRFTEPLPCHWTIGAWRRASGTIRTPCSAHRLAGEAGNPAGCALHVAETGGHEPLALRPHPVSSGR
jgi:hypothetical protein